MPDARYASAPEPPATFAATSAHPIDGNLVADWTSGRRITPLTLINAILRRCGIVTLSIVVCALIAGLVAALQPPRYSSEASFMPEQSGRADMSRISGLASQLGLNVPSGASQPPYFYVDLLRSRQLLGAAVDARYTVRTPTGPTTGDLTVLLEANGRTQIDRREAAIRKLRSHAVPSVQAKSGVITLSVTTKYPELSKQIGDTLLGLLNQFNINTRRAQYAAERAFAQERLNEARMDVAQAEGRLRAFLDQNRDGASAPRLSFERQRLEREASMQQQLASSLIQTFEQARLEEFRNTPLIAVIQPPDMPVEPDQRFIVSRTAVGMLLGLTLGAILALLLEGLALLRASTSPSVVEFRRLFSDSARTIWRPWSRLRAR